LFFHDEIINNLVVFLLTNGSMVGTAPLSITYLLLSSSVSFASFPGQRLHRTIGNGFRKQSPSYTIWRR